MNKKAIMLGPLLTGLTALALTSWLAAQTQDPAKKYEALLGTWDIQVSGTSYAIVFEFFLEDGALKGKYIGASGTSKMDNLTFEDHALKFSVSLNSMTLEYTAVIAGDSLSGEVSLQSGQTEITGKRRQT